MSAKDLELGKARAEKVVVPGYMIRRIFSDDLFALQLAEISRQFVLRRTADILSHYLPAKRE